LLGEASSREPINKKQKSKVGPDGQKRLCKRRGRTREEELSLD